MPLPKTDKKVGIDLGIKDFAVTSDGEIFENLKWLRKSERRLKKLQKDLSRKEKGSKNIEKNKIKSIKTTWENNKSKKRIFAQIKFLYYLR